MKSNVPAKYPTCVQVPTSVTNVGKRMKVIRVMYIILFTFIQPLLSSPLRVQQSVVQHTCETSTGLSRGQRGFLVALRSA